MSDYAVAQDLLEEDAVLLDDEVIAERRAAISNTKIPGAVVSGRYLDDPDAPASPDLWGSASDGRGAPMLRLSVGSMVEFFKTPSIYVLLPPFLFLTITNGGLIAPKINLLLQLVCRAYYAGDDGSVAGRADQNCQTPQVHASLSKFNMTVSLVQGLIAAVVSPKLGVLSDRIGRKPILAVGVIGPMMSCMIAVLAAKSTSTTAYQWFWVAALCDGLSGSMATMMASAHAYTADCTVAEKRATAFGLFHACLFAGSAIGPALAGIIIRMTGSIMSIFYLCIFSNAVFMIAMIFLIPESLPLQHRMEAREMHSLQTQFDPGWRFPRSFGEARQQINFLGPLAILFNEERPDIRQNLIILSSIDMLLIGAGVGSMMILILYAELTFHWDSVKDGYFLSASGSTRAIMLVVVLPIIVRFLRHRDIGGINHIGASFSDIAIIRYATFCEVVAMFGFACARNSSQFFICGILGAVGGIASPTLQSTLTKHTKKTNVGALLGALSLLHCVCNIIAPSIFSSIYAFTVGFYPKAFFIALCMLYLTTFFLSFFIIKNDTYPVSYDEAETETRPTARGGIELSSSSRPHLH
ncbi:major facilitator superfamily domain-containing protein [Limtongia smithiae]|uniref:major facilitator superfamily domain-containing protein n=1 Tax=Limtongia smithiae TaxID=1125753 RepID=UPI0034CEF8FB